MKKTVKINITKLNDFFLYHPSEIDFVMGQLFLFIYHGYVLLVEQHYVEMFGGAESKYLLKVIRNEQEFLEWYLKIIQYR